MPKLTSKEQRRSSYTKTINASDKTLIWNFYARSSNRCGEIIPQAMRPVFEPFICKAYKHDTINDEKKPVQLITFEQMYFDQEEYAGYHRDPNDKTHLIIARLKILFSPSFDPKSIGELFDEHTFRDQFMFDFSKTKRTSDIEQYKLDVEINRKQIIDDLENIFDGLAGFNMDFASEKTRIKQALLDVYDARCEQENSKLSELVQPNKDIYPEAQSFEAEQDIDQELYVAVIKNDHNRIKDLLRKDADVELMYRRLPLLLLVTAHYVFIALDMECSGRFLVKDLGKIYETIMLLISNGAKPTHKFAVQSVEQFLYKVSHAMPETELLCINILEGLGKSSHYYPTVYPYNGSDGKKFTNRMIEIRNAKIAEFKKLPVTPAIRQIFPVILGDNYSLEFVALNNPSAKSGKSLMAIKSFNIARLLDGDNQSDIDKEQMYEIFASAFNKGRYSDSKVRKECFNEMISVASRQVDLIYLDNKPACLLVWQGMHSPVAPNVYAKYDALIVANVKFPARVVFFIQYLTCQSLDLMTIDVKDLAHNDRDSIHDGGKDQDLSVVTLFDGVSKIPFAMIKDFESTDKYDIPEYDKLIVALGPEFLGPDEEVKLHDGQHYTKDDLGQAIGNSTPTAPDRAGYSRWVAVEAATPIFAKVVAPALAEQDIPWAVRNRMTALYHTMHKDSLPKDVNSQAKQKCIK